MSIISGLWEPPHSLSPGTVTEDPVLYSNPKHLPPSYLYDDENISHSLPEYSLSEKTAWHLESAILGRSVPNFYPAHLFLASLRDRCIEERIQMMRFYAETMDLREGFSELCNSVSRKEALSLYCQLTMEFRARLGEGVWSYDILGRAKGKNAKETMEKYEEKYPGFAFLGMMMEFQAELQKKVKKGAISWTEDIVDGSPIYHFAFHFRRGSGNSQTVRTCQLRETRFLANEMFPKHPDRGGEIGPVQDQELRAELQPSSRFQHWQDSMYRLFSGRPLRLPDLASAMSDSPGMDRMERGVGLLIHQAKFAVQERDASVERLPAPQVVDLYYKLLKHNRGKKGQPWRFDLWAPDRKEKNQQRWEALQKKYPVKLLFLKSHQVAVKRDSFAVILVTLNQSDAAGFPFLGFMMEFCKQLQAKLEGGSIIRSCPLDPLSAFEFVFGGQTYTIQDTKISADCLWPRDRLKSDKRAKKRRFTDCQM